MTPSDIAKHYLRFWSNGSLASNAPRSAHQLAGSAPPGPQQELLWRAVDAIARKKGVYKPSEEELHAWLATYPRAIEKVAEALDAGRSKILFWEGVAKAYRTEFLAMTDIAHKHFAAME